jgi:hypothetical protein
MKSRFAIAAAAALLLACGSKGGKTFTDGGSGEDSGVDPCVENPFDPMCEGLDETGGEAAPACDNLECQIVNCGTTDGTTITGTVYDPAAKRGLYNVFVYVPNRPLDPIPTGPVCTACQAPASGKPLVSAVTDSKGKFTIKNAPAGANIPIVMQLGKWRRRINVPTVSQCTVNNLTNKDQTRLPKKQSEGNADSNIPLIAFGTGCDQAECFLQRTVGIDGTEFGAAGSKARVHVYKGIDNAQQFAFTPTDAYAFWGSLPNLKKYDIVFNACECDAYDRQGAYGNMKAYLEAGGRMFGTHYHYNWFAQPTGPADFQMQAPWLTAGYDQPPFTIDDSFPRGKAFADWLQFHMVTTTYGQIAVTDTRNDVNSLNAGMKGNGSYKNATQWIFSQNQTLYMSFNTPTNKVPKDQCGRAVFSDVHLSGSFFGGGTFPSYCAPNQHDVDEGALEFLFFDLSSCVQDDKSNPIQPPPN